MAVAGLCTLLIVVWTLCAYGAITLPISESVFAWLRRQWLFEGNALLACLGVLAVTLCSHRRRTLPRMHWWETWWVWMLWAGLSCLYSIDRGASLRSWFALLSYGLLAAVVCALVQSPKDLLIWMAFLVAAAVVASCEGLFQYFGTFRDTLHLMERLQSSGELHFQGWGEGVVKDFLIRKRIFSVFGWPNLFAGFLLLMIPLAAGLCAHARTRVARIGWAAATGLFGTCLILTLSMGAWIAAILSGSVTWWLLRRPSTSARNAQKAPARALAIGAVICGLVCVTSFIAAKRARPLILASTHSRLVYVLGAVNVMRSHPLLGTGLGTFGLGYRALMPLERIEGEHSALHAHNTVLEFGAELGLVGLVCLGLFLWRVWTLIGWATQPHRGGTPLALRRGLAIGLLAFFIHSLLEQTFFEGVTAPFWWIALGLLAATRREEVKEEPLGGHRLRYLYVPVGAAVLGLLVVSRLAAADFWAGQAAVRSLAGEHQRAIEAFERAERMDPLASRYPMEMTELLLKHIQGQSPQEERKILVQAQRQLQQAVALSPWLGYAWLRLGIVTWQLGEHDAAITAVRRAVLRDPNSRAAAVHLGHMLLAVGRFEELQKAAQRLQVLEPSDPQGWFLEAMAWQKLHDSARAKLLYQQAVQQFPDYYPAWFNLAQSQSQEGDRAGAVISYQKFLQTAPEGHVGARATARAYLDANAPGARNSP